MINGPLSNEPRVHAGVLETLMNHLGVLCYSASINDPVIWSHYAERHRGVALGFEYAEPDQEPLQVRYSKHRPILDFKKIQGPPDAALDRVIEDAFMTKAESWDYEREYRHFIRLDVCTMVGAHYFKVIPIKSLREVVLGARCPLNVRDIYRVMRPAMAASDSLAAHPSPVYPTGIDVRFCRMNETGFELDFESFTLPASWPQEGVV
jgi:hypothetical protein